MHRFEDILNIIQDHPLATPKEISLLVSKYRDHMPVLYDDLVISAVFVDMARYPVVLLSKFRSANFPGFKIEYYNKLSQNFQCTRQGALIDTVVKARNLIVIEDVQDPDEYTEEINKSEMEIQYMIKNDWKSVIFHSLFHEEADFGYLVIFTQKSYLNQAEIDAITDYLAQTMPALSERLLPAAFNWKSEMYRKDIKELETNLSDLIIAITELGEIVRVNTLTSYYLGSPPEELLGKLLQDISPPLYEAIMRAGDLDRKRDRPLEVQIPSSTSGQQIYLELNVWSSELDTEDTIVCFATDITLMKIYEEERRMMVNRE